jgi:serine O-acetyltransferase
MSELRACIEADLYRGRRVRFFAPRLAGLLLFARGGRGCTAWRRLCESFERRGQTRLAEFCCGAIERRYGCYISRRAKIGPRLRLPHPVGIVIGDGVVIGNGCTIYQHVTLGGRRLGDWQHGRYPVVGDGVVLFAGAVIAGSIVIGDHSTVGANAVVLDDIPADSIAVGNPARALPKARRDQARAAQS